MGEKDATGRMEQQILQIAQGNKDAFASFYEETRTALFAFLLSYLDRQEAEDALQDVYKRQCQYEPIVEVLVPGQEKVTYAKMTPEKVARVVVDHLVNGNVVTEYTVGSLMK